MGKDRYQHHFEHQPDTPATTDGARPPQFDTVNCRSRIGCTCTSCRGEGQSDGAGGGGSLTNSTPALSYVRSDTASEDGNSVEGEEGVADHHLWVPEHGWISIRAFNTAQSKHELCTCHNGVLPESNDYPFGSPSASGSLANASMKVESSGDEHGLDAYTLFALSQWDTCTSSSGILPYVGQHFHGETVKSCATPHHFTAPPLKVTHEREFCRNMIIGVSYDELPYGLDLSISEDATGDHSRYDVGERLRGTERVARYS
ncbi:hypothetical protein BAUCODRAFT_239923 [Baudoinia panamericana UAMH 10762]|uniref:Uncharacterized protein n=1 Tax=Baudoinia panamericana (strain UAMH 10762) TaxID=717646 RepID=M2MAB6_BAUPA|nr:uncharacterized protein BAUCODRAFT_239923 [Baudoinia panamericana UAMH 10762]EMC93416.1 hypothetical protein BAUCODRAFT_239923 [Baudoinia panamericana UAMH 10762]